MAPQTSTSGSTQCVAAEDTQDKTPLTESDPGSSLALPTVAPRGIHTSTQAASAEVALLLLTGPTVYTK